MRWEALFADLEAQAEALERAERAGEVEDRIRGELAQQTMGDRLRAAAATAVQIELAGGTVAAGTVRRAGAGWVLLDGATQDSAEWLIRLPAVRVVRGLSRLTAVEPPDLIESRLGIGRLLRALARERAQVSALLVDGSSVYGTVDRVGADFVELAVHAAGEARRRRAVLDVRLVALAAVAAFRRHGSS
jgi:hypothetical protein